MVVRETGAAMSRLVHTLTNSFSSLVHCEFVIGTYVVLLYYSSVLNLVTCISTPKGETGLP
jgi:hypothetical protein